MNDKDILSILDDINDRFGEWIEMAGERSPELLTTILCRMVMEEREKTEYYKRCFNVSFNAR